MRWLGMLGLWAMGAALSACPSPGIDSNAGGLHGVCTVIFDKNGGETGAVPSLITIQSPATTVGTLPAEPTWTGSQFEGWNTERDGSGEPFTADTPACADFAITVYAQWKHFLDAEIFPSEKTLTPMEGTESSERSTTFTVTVSGFKSEADAGGVGLEVERRAAVRHRGHNGERC